MNSVTVAELKAAIRHATADCRPELWHRSPAEVVRDRVVYLAGYLNSTTQDAELRDLLRVMGECKPDVQS